MIRRILCALLLKSICIYDTISRLTRSCLALKSSLNLRYQTIFHTDKGSEFVNHALKRSAAVNNVLVSNTGKFHCYENAFMESLNRTLKHSQGLRTKFSTKSEAVAEISKAIYSYNTLHQHSKLGKRTPYTVLMSYTGKKSETTGGKSAFCTTSGKVARIYSKSLIVKIKRIGTVKPKTKPKQ